MSTVPTFASSSRLVGVGIKPYEILITEDSFLKGMHEAYLAATYGNTNPTLIRIGKGVEDLLAKKAPECELRWVFTKPRYWLFHSAVVIVDERMDSWKAEFFIFDHGIDPPYQLLFVAATLEVKDGI
jgi:hypothetical protein